MEDFSKQAIPPLPAAILSADYQENCKHLDEVLRLEASYDLIGRDILIGGKKARFYFIDGYLKDDIMEKMLEYLMAAKPEALASSHSAQAFAAHCIPYVECEVINQIQSLVTAILSGTLALLLEDWPQAILIDARTYPARNVQEPDNDRVLRGSRDGFVETLVHNTALIRRRIRDPNLTMEIRQIGNQSQTDLVICYMKDRVNPQYLLRIQEKISHIQVDTLTMGQESLAECLVPSHWLNPFPKVRYTERPDAASASVIEGSILLVIDNSPAVMILPTSFFDFAQDTNDYYFPPIIGTYLHLVRMLIFCLTLFLTPLWYLLVKNPTYIPACLQFIQVAEPNQVPIIAQLLIIELMIDCLKLASLNTPTVLSNSFSVVGALILGDFAVQARWFVPEVVLYMAFVAIANFTQTSFELGYALKLFRILILILTALFNLGGFVAGLLLLVLALSLTKTVTGGSYLYPLIPFKASALKGLLTRRPISRRNS